MITALRFPENRVGATGDLDDAPEEAAIVNARLAAIVDSCDDAIVGKTLDGIITAWNRSAQRIFGYTEDEAIGQHITLIVPVERHAEEAEVLARLRRGERIEHFETVRLAKDGTRIDVSLTVSPIRNAQGRIVGASKVARDITERKLAQDILREGVQVRETLSRIGASLAAEIDPDKLIQAVIDAATTFTAAEFGVVAECRRNAPGVYVEGRKLASVGIRVRRGASFHGLAMNVSLDLEPFTRINPCGYQGLEMTQLAALGGPSSVTVAADGLESHLLRALGFSAR